MKKRILTLALVLILVFSAVAVPVSAATGKDVHKYLKEVAMEGYHDSDLGCWYDGFYLDESSGLIYAVYYWEKDQYIESTVFCGDFEVTWRISSNPSPSYNVYVLWYTGDSFPKGTVSLAANYNGAAYTSFREFTGATSYKSDMLDALNEWLPVVVEFTRAVINEAGYTLKDLGLTGYNKCTYVHAYDEGKVTTQPTCASQGVKTYTCRVCGATRVEYISPTGVHTWSLTRILQKPSTGYHGGQALYTCSVCGTTKTAELCAKEVFTDMVKKNHWAHDAIDWAFFNGITGGTGDGTTFSPNKVVTRGEVVTFLYTMKGKPAVSGTNPFTDVKKKDFYYNAVLWAVQNEITGGTTATTFSPKKTCTRAEIVMFLWGAAGKPKPKSTTNPFKDVKKKDYFYDAVLWAVENGITGGVDDTHFGPKVDCSRAQVMTFLYAASPILMP